MDFKVIKGINNYIYDSIQEFQALKPNTPYVQDWRFANEKDFDRGIFYETPENGLFEVKWPKGNLRYQWYYKDGIRADGISKSWNPDGTIKYTTYWKEGKEYKREKK